MRAMRMKRAWGVVAVLALLTGLVACDAQRVEKLEEGVATEADVRKQFGTPSAVAQRADGSKLLEYPRQPEGWTNYAIVIGPDGKMSSLRQLLTPANFAKVQPGMDKLQVMELLGKTAKSQFFELKGEEIWDWRYMDGRQYKVFTVSFDRQGKVVSSASIDDPKEMIAGGK